MILVILLAVVMAVLGAPLFAILAVVGVGGFLTSGTPLPGAIDNVYRLAGAEAVSLSTIPLFTFAGYLMAQAKTARRLGRHHRGGGRPHPAGAAQVALRTALQPRGGDRIGRGRAALPALAAAHR